MKKGALISSVAMLLVAVIAMTTASFAWFSSSTTPSVGSFDVTVTTQDALLISAKRDSGFKSILPLEDLTAIASNDLLQDAGAELTNATLGSSSVDTNTNSYNPITAIKKPVVAVTDKFALGFITSSNGNFKPTLSTGTDDAKFNTNIGMYTGVGGATALTDGSTDMIDNPAGKTNYFIKFDLFFKSTIMDNTKTLTLQLDTTVDGTTDTVSSSFDMFRKKTGAETEDVKLVEGNEGFHLPKTLRMGFVSAKLKPDGDAAADPTVKVFDPYGNHAAITDITGLFPVDQARNYASTKGNMAIKDIAGSPTPSNFDIVAGIASGDTYQVRIYIWIDGNDPEANNFILGKDTYLKSALSFNGKLV